MKKSKEKILYFFPEWMSENTIDVNIIDGGFTLNPYNNIEMRSEADMDILLNYYPSHLNHERYTIK